MQSGLSPDPNLAALAGLVREAAGQGARYVLSPEVTTVFAESREGLRAVTGPWEGNPAVAACGGLAREHGVFLHLGSMAVALPDGRFANRSVLFAPDGAVAATYDKIHLFDADLPGLRAYRESDTYRGGDVAVVSDAPGFGLGFTICYDLRFPALHRALAEAGAVVLAAPSAFTRPTGEAHWEVLLRARAIETGAFVVAPAQGGLHEDGRQTWGHSTIVDPWGAVLKALDHDEPGLVIADLDLDLVNDARAKVPAWRGGMEFSGP
jgi:deaminated glutathione amidase